MARRRPATHRSARSRTATLGAVAIATALSLSACGGTDAAATGSGGLKVGVFFPGSISDTGFMQSGYLGYQRIQQAQAGEVELSYVEQVQPSDYEQALVRFASSNDLVISLGGQTDADVRKVAPQFPDVKFVEIGGPADAAPLPNLAYYDPQQAEAEFLSGAVSAMSSKTGKIGFVGGVELPAIVNAATAYSNGAKFARPDVAVLPAQFVGDFNDPAKAKQAAAATYGAGADVLGQNVNLGKQGMQQAAQESGKSMVGGPIPGDCTDSTVIGYVHTDIGKELEYAVKAVQENTWKAEQVRFGLTSANGGTDFALCGTDPEVTATLQRAEAQLAAQAVQPY